MVAQPKTIALVLILKLITVLISFCFDINNVK